MDAYDEKLLSQVKISNKNSKSSSEDQEKSDYACLLKNRKFTHTPTRLILQLIKNRMHSFTLFNSTTMTHFGLLSKDLRISKM